MKIIEVLFRFFKSLKEDLRYALFGPPLPTREEIRAAFREASPPSQYVRFETYRIPSYSTRERVVPLSEYHANIVPLVSRNSIEQMERTMLLIRNVSLSNGWQSMEFKRKPAYPKSLVINTSKQVNKLKEGDTLESEPKFFIMAREEKWDLL